MMRNLIKKIIKESDFDWIKDEGPFLNYDYRDLINATPDEYKKEWRFFNSEPVQKSNRHDVKGEIEFIRDILQNGFKTSNPDEVYIEKIIMSYDIIILTIIQKSYGSWAVRDVISMRRGGFIGLSHDREMIVGSDFHHKDLLESDFKWIRDISAKPDNNRPETWEGQYFKVNDRFYEDDPFYNVFKVIKVEERYGGTRNYMSNSMWEKLTLDARYRVVVQNVRRFKRQTRDHNYSYSFDIEPDSHLECLKTRECRWLSYEEVSRLNDLWEKTKNINEEDDFDWIRNTKPKTIEDLEVGDVVRYEGEYEDCHGYDYHIVKIYPDHLNRKTWFDLDLDIDSEEWRNSLREGNAPYPYIWSVPFNEIVLPQDINESDFSWIRDVPQAPNYEGHPQGVTYVYSHEEIDEFMELLTKYNKSIGAEDPNPCKGDCGEYHDALEDRRDELEWMSQEDGVYYGEAMLALSFFIESKFPNKLSTGYWNYEVDRDDVQEWLGYGDTHNTDYQIYQRLSDMKALFSGILKEESNELQWIKDTEPLMWDKDKWYCMDVSNLDGDTICTIAGILFDIGYDADINCYGEEVNFLYIMPDVEDIGWGEYVVDYSSVPINDMDRFEFITQDQFKTMVKNYETKKGGDWWRDF